MMSALMLLITMVVAVPDRPDPTPKDIKPQPAGIQGEWKVVRVVVLGQTQNPPDTENTVGIITANEFLTVKKGKQADQKSTYVLDTTKSPHAIDIVALQAGMERKMLGICKLEGDTLTFCLNALGTMRPTSFASKADDQTVLLVLQRVSTKGN